MKALKRVDEVKDLRQDRCKWKDVVSAYPAGRGLELYVSVYVHFIY